MTKNDGFGENMIENKIKYYRNKAGLTQYELAKLVGLTRRGILQIEKEQQDIKVSNAIKLAKVLRTSVEELFVFSDNRELTNF